MKNKNFMFLDKFTTKKFLLFGLGVILFVNIVLFPFLPKVFRISISPENILDLKFGYNKTDVFNIFNNLKEEGRQAYKFFDLFVDMPYLIFYTFYYVVFMYYLLKIKNTNRLFLLLFPFLIGFFDFLENIGILILLKQYPDLNVKMVFFTSLFTKLKWSFALLTIISVLFLFFFYGKKTKN